MKNILVPIDFSDNAVNALEFAIMLSNCINAEIKMTHVLKPVSTIFNSSDNPKITEEKRIAQDYFRKLTDRYSLMTQNAMSYEIRCGNIFNEIAEQAKYGDSTIIVIGTHGSSGFDELWLGSTAHKVINNSPCPVISIRQSFTPRSIKKIVLPIDSSPETRQKVPFVSEIATQCQAEVHVIDICENNKLNLVERIEEYKAQTVNFLLANNVKTVVSSARGNNLTNMTIEYAQSIDTDIIAIMTEQSESTKNLWLGPYAQQMVNHSPIPILSVHPY